MRWNFGDAVFRDKWCNAGESKGAAFSSLKSGDVSA
jgi:hypothetical protein